MAIEHALKVLSWFENYSSEEVPPEFMWEDDDGVEKWFKTVKENKDNDYPTGDDDDGNPRMLNNDLADTFRNL